MPFVLPITNFSALYIIYAAPMTVENSSDILLISSEGTP